MAQPPRAALLLAAACLIGFMAGGGARASVALLTDSEARQATFTTAASFDTVAPTVARSVISKTTPYTPGYLKQGGTYYVYAQVTDGGAVPSGVSTVTANVSNVTTGQTALSLASGSFSVGGISYNYRSASLTANAVLTEGSKSYTITSTDVAGNSATSSGWSVTVDNTHPSGSDVQTANAGVTGRPEISDTITFTFSEPIDPETVLSGWTGASTSVVVRITNAGGATGDQVTVRNLANITQLPLGQVNLIGTGYVTTNRDFGATGTASTMVLSGNTIVITLGTASGAVTTQATGSNMLWTPTATMTDRAANTCLTTLVTESGTLDLDF